MAKTELQTARDIIGAFIEECGADAVVIIYSKVKKLKTETHIIPYGNAHTCNALIDYAYESYQPPSIELNLKTDDDE